MTAMQIRELCHEWQAGLTRRDIRALADLYAEDAVVESPLAGTMSGRDAAVTAFQGLFGAFPDMSWSFEPPIAEGNRVAFVADNPGNWMVHCHIIEHQDTGMMAWFEVA